MLGQGGGGSSRGEAMRVLGRSGHEGALVERGEPRGQRPPTAAEACVAVYLGELAYFLEDRRRTIWFA